MPMTTAAACSLVQFSTDDFAERERVARWREEFGRGLGRVDIAPLASDRPFHHQATLQAFPGLRLVSCTGSTAIYNRTPTLAAEGDDSIGLIVALKAKATASQRGKTMSLEPGDAVPVLTGEPGMLMNTGQLGVVFERTKLSSRVRHIDDRAMQVIPQASEPLRLLVGYITLLQQTIRAATPQLIRTAINHIYDLAALAIDTNPNTRAHASGAIAAARLTKALADIAERFTAPELDVKSVARRQGISPRYLQRLLEESGMSFTARVNELRLQKALALLTPPHDRGRPISDVAIEVGFSDISHFNRLFRARFGDTPRRVRARST
jgi:AraC-like DNA-binding protein